LASQSRQRYVRIDATLSADQIFAIVMARATPLLPPVDAASAAARLSFADLSP
jgi:hypothetical protein